MCFSTFLYLKPAMLLSAFAEKMCHVRAIRKSNGFSEVLWFLLFVHMYFPNYKGSTHLLKRMWKICKE